MASLNIPHNKIQKPTRRILIVGGSGSGKSSLVNLLRGNDEATISNGLAGCTFQCESYDIEKDSIHYYLTDTVGFDEPDGSKTNHKEAIKNLVKFAKNHKDGFNLILFVMKKDRIKKSFVESYKFFYDVLFSSEVPCILYISHTEMEENISEWISTEKNVFNTYNLNFKDIICGGAKKSNKKNLEVIFKEVREGTCVQIWNSIKARSLPNSCQMKTGVDWWGTVINWLYGWLSSRNYVKSGVEKKLDAQLQAMGLDQATIIDIIKLVNE